MKLYLAHPISGLSFDEVYQYFDGAQQELNEYYEVLHPMTGKGYFREEKNFKTEGYTQPLSNNHAIMERDSWMVSQADVVLIDLTGTKSVSIGCVMELAWAFWQHKHTVVVIDPGNVHSHAFVLEAADVIYNCLPDAIDYLRKLARGRW